MSGVFEPWNVRRKKHLKKINMKLVCKVSWRGNQSQNIELWRHFSSKGRGNNIAGVNAK